MVRPAISFLVARYNFKMLQLFVTCILMVCIVPIFNAAAYGSSVEDLVGVFSMQKTIKLGSSGCFGSSKSATDQDPFSRPNIAFASNRVHVLAGFSLEPKAINASLSSQSVNVNAHVIDDQGGLAGGSESNLSTAWFVSPSGKQTSYATFDAENLTYGTKMDGFYSSKIIFPKNIEKGAWRLDNLTLVDEIGNRRVIRRDEMFDLGFPTQFLVA
jgi:hypothetical protein